MFSRFPWLSRLSRSSRKSILLASVTALAAGAMPLTSSAGTFSSWEAQALTFGPAVPAPQPDEAARATPSDDGATDLTSMPKFLDVAPAAPQIHGFFDSPFKSAYITPRGLVVENQGVVWQPVVGLVFPLPDIGLKKMSLVAGIWNSVNGNQGDPRVGAWDEMDVFVGFGGQITDELRLDVDYEAWNFPTSTINKPQTEHVAQFKVSYDDSKYWGKSGFALHPYLNFFWSISGSSTVVNGRAGSTYYFEPGIVPTYTYNWNGTPLTFTFPTYVSIGPENYWGRGDSAFTKPDGNLGVFSTSINLTVPLKFIPVQYGNWHAEIGGIYYHLFNDALLRAGTLLSGNDKRDAFNAYIGVGVGF